MTSEDQRFLTAAFAFLSFVYICGLPNVCDRNLRPLVRRAKERLRASLSLRFGDRSFVDQRLDAIEPLVLAMDLVCVFGPVALASLFEFLARASCDPTSCWWAVRAVYCMIGGIAVLIWEQGSLPFRKYGIVFTYCMSRHRERAE